jgi:hypothetical protein
MIHCFEKGQEKRSIPALKGRITSLGNVAEAAGRYCRGIARRDYPAGTPYFAQTFVALIALPAAHYPGGTYQRKVPLIKAGLKEIIHIAQVCPFQKIRPLRRNILFSAITGTATLTMAWFAQPFFEYTRSLTLPGSGSSGPP